MSIVTVHKWQKYDISTDEMQVSRRMATAAAIERLGGTLIDGTACEIDVSELDPKLDGMTPRNFHPRTLRFGVQTQVS